MTPNSPLHPNPANETQNPPTVWTGRELHRLDDIQPGMSQPSPGMWPCVGRTAACILFPTALVGALLLATYHFILAFGESLRMNWTQLLPLYPTNHYPTWCWLTLVLASVGCVILQGFLFRAAARRRRFTALAFSLGRRGVWKGVLVVRGARLWPELAALLSILVVPTIGVALVLHNRSVLLQPFSPSPDPWQATHLVVEAIAFQVHTIICTLATWALPCLLGATLVAILLGCRWQINALRQVSMSLPEKHPTPNNPYRSPLRDRRQAAAWLAIPGPSTQSALLLAAACVAFVLLPAAWGVFEYARHFPVSSAWAYGARWSPKPDDVQLLADEATTALTVWFRWAVTGLGVTASAALAVASRWARKRSRIAPGLSSWPCPSLRATGLVVATSAAVSAALSLVAFRYRSENLLSEGRNTDELTCSPVMPNHRASFVSGYDPVVLVSERWFAVDGIRRDDPESLTSRLLDYRLAYPSWSDGQDRFAVLMSSIGTPAARLRTALQAARTAGYATALVPPLGFCRTSL